MKIFFATLAAASALFLSCNGLVKNEDAKVTVEKGTEVDTATTKDITKTNVLGAYVGMFEVDENDSVKQSKSVSAGEAFYWTRANKIALFIDSISNNTIKGHSVVAGNSRPFNGTVNANDNGLAIEAKEPGNDKYDGAFSFILKDTVINGIWKAFAKIDIQKRKYSLVKKEFNYDANQMLTGTSRFINWNKTKISAEEKKKLKAKMTKEERDEYEEFDEDTEFASATNNIYSINASNTLLTDDVLANLSKGDLLVIRNTIYARHGYSFKNRPLRVFFDEQPWYIPVNVDIKAAFTEIEKKNIPLLLKYEKVAKEYYDYFGRG